MRGITRPNERGGRRTEALSGHAELAAELARLVESRFLDSLELLLDAGEVIDDLRRQARTQADEWARRLLDGSDETATRAVITLVSALYPSDGPFDPPAHWWRTSLGQVVARRVGHPYAEALSYPVAGAMLGVTRQGVHDLATRGKLDRHASGGVTAASVRARLNQYDTAADRRRRPPGTEVDS